MVGHQNGGGAGGQGGGGGPLGGGGSLADSMSIGTDSRPLSPSGKGPSMYYVSIFLHFF